MFTGLPIACAKEPEKSLPSPHLSELLQVLTGSVLTALHAGIVLLPKPVVDWCIACWDSIASQACN